MKFVSIVPPLDFNKNDSSLQPMFNIPINQDQETTTKFTICICESSTVFHSMAQMSKT